MSDPNSSDLLGDLKSIAGSAEGRRLPSIRELASRWGVSGRTVQIVVRTAVTEGWLETRQGSGIWTRGSMPGRTAPPPRLDASRLSEIVSEEIRVGGFASGQTLPSPKDASHRHGVHPSTVRKAYGRLESRGLAQRQGRSWIVSKPRIAITAPAPVVLCIGKADAEGNLRMDSDREWDFWREIQLEAIRCGVQPVIVATDSTLPEIGGNVFGAIVSTWHHDDTSPILDVLFRQRLPTAVWIATQEVLPGDRYRHARTMWFHDLAHARAAGRTMAGYLGRLEHANIAWISPFHGSSWSRNRMAGLKQGLGKGVELFEATGDLISEWDVQVEVAEDPAVLHRVSLEGIDHGGEPEPLRRALLETVTRNICLEGFGPRLQAALESGATLWVAASDLVAQWCRHWLRSRGIPRSRWPALVGFDDTRESSRTGLTSFRFDVQGMARAMVRQILSSRRENRLVTRYGGFVVERASSARSPGG